MVCETRSGKKLRCSQAKGCLKLEITADNFSHLQKKGLLTRASTQMPIDSDEERRVDDEFANPDKHVVDLGDEGDDAPVSKRNCRRSSGQSSGRPTKSSWSSGMNRCLDAITSACIAKAKAKARAKAKAEELKYQVAQHQRQQVVEDPYSIKNCIDIINTMTTWIQPAHVGKAVDMFVKQAVYREAFISMGDELRRVWLNSLVE